MAAPDSTQRFSSRVGNYVRYRPDYPAAVLDLLKSDCGFTRESIIADIASGTGIFTRMLLDNGNRVFGVEPNAEMRNAAEEFLRAYSGFTSVPGTAESTTLAAHSVDLVTAAQAAHWFDREKARREFVRIGKPGAWTVLLWNERRTDSTPFLIAYEQLLVEYGTDYQEVRSERTTQQIETFFAPSRFQVRTFDYEQEFDYPALEGRLLSSSYTPQAGDAKHAPMLHELRRMFDEYQVDHRVRFEYDTRVYLRAVGLSLAEQKLFNHRGALRTPRQILGNSIFARRYEWSSEKTFHMTPDEFRRHGHAVVDWIADYYARIESFPVLSQVAARTDSGIAAARSSGPRRAISGNSGGYRKADPSRRDALAISQFLRLLSFECLRPGDSGRFAFFRTRGSGNAVGDQPGLHRTRDPCAGLAGSHARSAAEVSFDRAAAEESSRTRLPAHRCARCWRRGSGRRTLPAIAAVRGQTGRLHFSQAHSSLEKDAQIAGIGRDHLRMVDVDEAFAMRPEGAGAADRAGPRGRTGSIFCLCHGGHHFFECD